MREKIALTIFRACHNPGFPVIIVILMHLNRYMYSMYSMQVIPKCVCLWLANRFTPKYPLRRETFFTISSLTVYTVAWLPLFCCRLLDCLCVCVSACTCTCVLSCICARERERRRPSPCVSGEQRILITEKLKHNDSCIVCEGMLRSERQLTTPLLLTDVSLDFFFMNALVVLKKELLACWIVKLVMFK